MTFYNYVPHHPTLLALLVHLLIHPNPEKLTITSDDNQILTKKSKKYFNNHLSSLLTGIPGSPGEPGRPSNPYKIKNSNSI